MTLPFSGGSKDPLSYNVDVRDHSFVAAIGPDAHVEIVTPRRPVSWPVISGSLPELASAFQPRQGLQDKIRGSLWSVLRGGGGTGKSQLAATTYKSSTADVRVWVSGESRVSVITGYAAAAVQLDLADADIGLSALAERFLGFLAGTDRSWIVVIDDLTDPANLGGLWPSGSGQVLVTTWRRDAALSEGGRTVIEVDVYSPEEAHSYLRERLRPWVDELRPNALDQADDLADDLGYLPLALSQTAAVIIDQAVSCAVYREWFADRTRKLDELFPMNARSERHAKTIATTWALAIEIADKLEPLGLSRPLAGLVACFDAAGAPEDAYTGEPVRRFLTGANGGEHVSAADARRALRVLHRLSLVTHDSRQDPPTVRMHSLTGRAIRQTHTADDITTLIKIAGDALYRAWPAVENNPAFSELFRANTAALEHLDPDALWHAEDIDGAAPILFKSGRSLLNAGLVAPAIDYFRDFVAQSRDHLGPDHPDSLAFRNDLAGAYKSAGDLKRAIPLYEQTLTDTERVFGPAHPNTLTCRNNLATAYQSAGDLKRAIPLYEQTLTDRRRILGPDHQDTLTSRNNLANAYQSAGDLKRAIPLYEQTLTDRLRVLGPDRPETIDSRINLAFAYQSAGDLKRAIPLYEQSLTDRRRILGPDHLDTLASRHYLANAYQSAGDLKQAIPLYEQNLTDTERVLGPGHPGTLTVRKNLAAAYEAAGDTT